MSIASRITEIEQHIGNAYDKIEDLGIDLTDVDKNINNISSMLENVWDEYPKVSASDVEEASLNGTKTGRINIDLKGNTEQEQLTGKNLVDIPDITLNSTGYIYNGNIDLKAGTYTLSMGQSSQASFSIAIIGENGTLVSGSITLPYTFTINEKATSMRLYSPGAGTFKNIMIEQGSTATSFEPYCGGIPSPSPDFPQQIKNVTGNANVKIQNKNLAKTTDCNIEETNANYKCINGLIEINVSARNRCYDICGGIITGNYLPISYANANDYYLTGKDKGTYKLSLPDLEATITGSANSIVAIYTNQREMKCYIPATGSIYGTTSFTLQEEEYVKSIYIWINGANSNTNIKTHIQLEQGSTATSYVAHQEQNYPFSLKSKNLFDFDYILQHKNDFVKEGQYFMFLQLDDKFKKQFTVSTILKGTSQNIIMGFSDTIFATGGNDKRTLNNGTIVSPKTFDFTNAENVYVFFANTSTISADKHEIDDIYNNYNIQVEQGTTATDYEPYYDIKAMQGTTLQDNGIHNTRKQIMLDGTENWLTFTSQGKTAYYMNLPDGTGQEVKCSHFICQVGGGFPEKNKVLYNGTTNKNIIFYTGDTENKLAEWKAYLAEQYANGTPVIVEYELETEEIIPYNATQQAQYNAIKKAQGYNDQTNISQTYDELPFILDIEALKNN